MFYCRSIEENNLLAYLSMDPSDFDIFPPFISFLLKTFFRLLTDIARWMRACPTHVNLIFLSFSLYGHEDVYNNINISTLSSFSLFSLSHSLQWLIKQKSPGATSLYNSCQKEKQKKENRKNVGRKSWLRRPHLEMRWQQTIRGKGWADSHLLCNRRRFWRVCPLPNPKDRSANRMKGRHVRIWDLLWKIKSAGK